MTAEAKPMERSRPPRLARRAWRWLQGGADAPPVEYRLTAWLFLRALALIYLVAFISFWVQFPGLIGSDGILPAENFVDRLREAAGLGRRLLYMPTLCYLSAGDFFLHALHAAGVVLSFMLLFDVAPALALALLWMIYLSIVQVGQVFLSYQWDILLLETGFLAIAVAPWRLWPRLRDSPATPILAILLLRWLLFRLEFGSGAGKLATGDETWRTLTALEYHYFTQPLPSWVSWYVHQMPGSFHRASVLGMFAIQLVVPFLFFGPRRLRLAAFALTAALQFVILLTGNYGFFNLLALALCVAVLDDIYWVKIVPQAWRGKLGLTQSETNADSPENGDDTDEARPECPFPARMALHARRIIMLLLAIVSFYVGMSLLLQRVLPQVARQTPAFIRAPYGWVAPYYLVNSYGLFTTMTTRRPEIIVQGSDDGETWQTFRFPWKMGELDRRPRFLIGHMPRLDWQMWFAALSLERGQAPAWFREFLLALLEGKPAVLGLLRENPFPDGPPGMIRFELYDYEFTDWGSPDAEENWWRRGNRRTSPALRANRPPSP